MEVIIDKSLNMAASSPRLGNCSDLGSNPYSATSWLGDYGQFIIFL